MSALRVVKVQNQQEFIWMGKWWWSGQLGYHRDYIGFGNGADVVWWSSVYFSNPLSSCINKVALSLPAWEAVQLIILSIT